MLPKYEKASCCNEDCYWLDLLDNEPCYGLVEVIGCEDFNGDWTYIHACEGHSNDGRYQCIKDEN